VAIQRVSHLGLCVSDLERSLRFYRDQLGFREVSRLGVSGGHADRLLELADVSLQAVYLERDGLRLELLHFAKPGHQGEPRARPMNQLGLTHLSLRVDHLDATLTGLRGSGATILEHTRIDLPAQRTAAIFVLDPDGTRLELVQMPGDPALPPG
jgi:lactoylglutathione lyase